MLLAAKSITYADPASGGASGIHFAKVLEHLGIVNEMKAKTVFPKVPLTATAIGDLVANGEAELGVNQFQELVAVPGIELVGPLPGDLQNTVVFAAAVMDSAKNVDVAKALVNFLRTPEAAAVIKVKGMEPATP
jgi:molybdate transport system substrate-binding protein